MGKYSGEMPADSVYSDDIRLLDDLTRLKLKVIQKKLNSNSHRDRDVLTPTKYRHHRRLVSTPTESEISITPPPERRRERFYRKMDRRNELLHKLWEELGDGGPRYQRSHHERQRHLPPLTPRRDIRNPPIFAFNEGMGGTGNTKKDLMELMLIQNAQLQQWMMSQTLARRANSAEDGPHHYHHYYGPNGALPPIKKTDSGAQYPQDFFEAGTSAQDAQTGTGGKNKRR